MENKLISAALHDREAFNTIISNIPPKSLNDKAKLVMKEIESFYKKDESASACDPEIIKDRLCRNYPKHAKLFEGIIDNLQPVSIPNLTAEILEARKERIKQDMINACTQIGNDNVIKELFQQFENCSTDDMDKHDTPEVHIAKSVAQVVEKTTGQNRIKIHPEAITQTTGGGLLRGHHVLVFARPDCGKTTLAISMLRGFCQQGLRTLYVGNEDPIDDIITRTICCLTGADAERVRQSPDKAEQAAIERGYDKIIFCEAYPGTPRQLESLVEEHRPDVLVVDQARNIELKQENKVLRLEMVEQFIRNLGKKFNMLTVSFTQAGDSAEGKPVLGMSDVDFSNTGMQASADLMVGMGVNQDYEAQGVRVLSFPKNKLSSDKEPKQVTFKGSISRIE